MNPRARAFGILTIAGLFIGALAAGVPSVNAADPYPSYPPPPMNPPVQPVVSADPTVSSSPSESPSASPSTAPARAETEIEAEIGRGLVVGIRGFSRSPVTVLRGGTITIQFLANDGLQGQLAEVWSRPAGGTWKFLANRRFATAGEIQTAEILVRHEGLADNELPAPLRRGSGLPRRVEQRGGRNRSLRRRAEWRGQGVSCGG